MLIVIVVLMKKGENRIRKRNSVAEKKKLE